MALGLPSLDPNALSATKLKSQGMTAQEVAFKRKAMEVGLAGQKLAADVKNKATDQKAKEANMKAFPPITDTVALPYTQEWKKRMAAEQVQLAKDLALWKQGKGSNPNDTLSEAGMARAARNAGHKQYAANTNAYYTLTNNLIDDIRKNPGSYVDGALEEALAAQRDVSVAETGQYPDLSKRLFDLQKHADTYLGAIKAGGSGDSYRDPVTGDIYHTSSESIIKDDVKAAIKAALLKPEARDEALRWFGEMPIDRQNAVMDFAKNNKMTPEEAMLYNVEMPIYAYTKSDRTMQQQSSVAYGQKKEEAAAREIFEVWRGVVDGTHGKYKDLQTALPDMKEATVQTLMKNNPSLKGMFELSETGWKLKPGLSLLKDLGKYTIGKEDEVSTEDGKIYANAIRPVLVIQDDATKNTIVVSGTASNIRNGRVRISEPMSRSEVYSKFFVPAALNTKGYDAGALDIYTESQGVNIKGTKGRINPENQDVNLLDRGGVQPNSGQDEKPKGIYNPITGKYE